MPSCPMFMLNEILGILLFLSALFKYFRISSHLSRITVCNHPFASDSRHITKLGHIYHTSQPGICPGSRVLLRVFFASYVLPRDSSCILTGMLPVLPGAFSNKLSMPIGYLFEDHDSSFLPLMLTQWLFLSSRFTPRCHNIRTPNKRPTIVKHKLLSSWIQLDQKLRSVLEVWFVTRSSETSCGLFRYRKKILRFACENVRVRQSEIHQSHPRPITHGVSLQEYSFI